MNDGGVIIGSVKVVWGSVDPDVVVVVGPGLFSCWKQNQSVVNLMLDDGCQKSEPPSASPSALSGETSRFVLDVDVVVLVPTGDEARAGSCGDVLWRGSLKLDV